MHTQKYILPALLVAAISLFYLGCDRVKGDEEPNQRPVVEFVNTPVDTSVFNYAPIVYWRGNDPDGLVSGFEYYDDTTTAALEAYRQDRITPGTLRAYIDGIAADKWTFTTRTEETIYLGTESGQTTEHVFMIRAIDNRGESSIPKVRTFFRTNLPPDPPLLKWADGEDEDYVREIVLPETLFWGDTLTTAYDGIEFLWQGTDPDSRELNIIPLEFSWVLVRVKNEAGEAIVDTIPHPIFNDSLRVIGYEGGWSQWTREASKVFYGQATGEYVFTLRVRDDGLTGGHGDSLGYARFYAIKPTFEYQLLIVDENKTPTAQEINNFGARPDTSIMQFYYDLLPQAFGIAEELRTGFPGYDTLYPEPFNYSFGPWGSGQYVQELDNKDAQQGGTIPYDVISKFKWVWLIDDDNPGNGNYDGVLAREKVMGKYLDVGGQLMISGRRLFDEGYMLTSGNVAAQEAGVFFYTYFNLNTVEVKSRWAASAGRPDFAGAVTANTFLPDLQIDTNVCKELHWGAQRFPYLPEVDYFSRAESQTSFDLSLTMYNYNSATADTGLAEYDTFNVDLEVGASTPSVAYLLTPREHNTVYQVRRIYNVTRDVPGQFLWFDSEGPANRPRRIVVSTPELEGRWLTTDVLQVDYTYSPISVNHNKPAATHFQKHEVTQTGGRGEFSFTLRSIYRTSLFTYPFSFLKTDPVEILPGYSRNPVAYTIANEILYFNGPRNVGDFDFD